MIKGKKLLVIGGASQHCKIIEAAKEMGVITYVIDFLQTSPAKEIADFSYQINVTETERLVQLCKDEKIDGILSGWLDFCQIPYQRLCEEVNLPCYGTREEFDILTNKAAFKKVCEEYEVGCPTAFPWEKYIALEDKELPFPVFVKPADSRGSRGSSMCITSSELREAVQLACSESFDSRAIAERYIQNAHAFLVVYFFVDGEPYLQQLSDAYFGDESFGLEKINTAYRTPSIYSDFYLKHAHEKVVSMLRGLGIMNGPVCFQGFFTENEVLLFDPGRRFPGGEYERAFKEATGVDIVKTMIEFALTGKMILGERLGGMPSILKGKKILRLQINIREGVIYKVRGFEEIKDFAEVVYVAKYHDVGDVIERWGDVRQRFAQIVLLTDDTDSLVRAVNKVYSCISILDENGKEMLASNLTPDILRGGKIRS